MKANGSLENAGCRAADGMLPHAAALPYAVAAFLLISLTACMKKSMISTYAWLRRTDWVLCKVVQDVGICCLLKSTTLAILFLRRMTLWNEIVEALPIAELDEVHLHEQCRTALSEL